MTRLLQTSWRWMTTVAAIAAAAFAMTAALAAPAQAEVRGASLYQCTFASQAPNHIGWATLAYRGCIVPGMATTADCRGADAWRWTGSSWQYHGLSECGGPRQVYVYPYAAGWSWIWSQQTGWLAVRSNLVLINGGYGAQVTCATCTAHAH